MRLYLTVSAFLALVLILPGTVSLSGPPEDLEGSGYDLDGSGSGDDPEQGTSNNPDPAIVSNQANGNKNAAKSSSTLNIGSSHRHDGNAAPELVVISNSESLLENKEIAAVIAGGLTGAIIGVLVSAILIYKWRKKRKEERILSQKKASDEDYHNSMSETLFM
ncbi:uncharacterized protein FYW61_020051 [Anableps anableps]